MNNKLKTSYKQYCRRCFDIKFSIIYKCFEYISMSPINMHYDDKFNYLHVNLTSHDVKILNGMGKVASFLYLESKITAVIRFMR